MRTLQLSIVSALAAAFLLTVPTVAPLAQQKGLPAGALHVERAVILDPTGFEAPMAASTLFLPSGWQTQGGVFWAREHMCTNGYNYNWTATSPDGTTTINVLPQERWETNNMTGAASTPGCQAAPYRNAQQYLQSVVQRWRPGARVLDFRVRQDLLQGLCAAQSSHADGDGRDADVGRGRRDLVRVHRARHRHARLGCSRGHLLRLAHERRRRAAGHGIAERLCVARRMASRPRTAS